MNLVARAAHDVAADVVGDDPVGVFGGALGSGVGNPDILATLGQSPDRPRLLIGFAAETDNVVANACLKRTAKNADWIVANDVSGDVMGGARNQVHLVTAAGVEDWPEASKDDVARQLIARIAEELQ